MFCPKCGQQQLSEEVRYCSRCGFALSGVVQLIAADGVHPALEAGEGKPGRSPRRRGIRQGALILFVAACLIPLIEALHLEPVIATLLMVGFMRIVYALIFQEGSLRRKKTSGERELVYVPPPALAQKEMLQARAAVLPAARSVLVSSYGQQQPRADTSEMSRPSSVTENTTKLLEDKDGV
ncbi:MAG TPA: zinc ribbon domain-containing protein [Pyrinomonadaceae bacterium]|jgi:hypothetical protein